MLLHYPPARYRAGWAAMPTGFPVPDHRPSLDKRGEEVKGVKEGKVGKRGLASVYIPSLLTPPFLV